MPSGPFAVAGFSLGGFVAMELCPQAADRVSGLALLATNAHVETKEGHQGRQRMIDAVRSGTGNCKSVAEAFLPLVVHPAHVKDSALVSLLIDMAREVGREGFVLQQITAINRPDNLGTLRALHVLALVMRGAGRPDQPHGPSEEIASVIEGSELVVADCGCMVTLEQPEATVRATQRWLKRVDTA